MTDPRTFLVVALGAALGGLCRYWVTLVFAGRLGPSFPYATFFINLTASFLIGVVAELAQQRAFGVTPLWRLALSTGFLGGYSTFSAFSVETLALGLEGNWLLAAAYSLGSVILGVGGAWGGLILTRVLLRAV